jgi:hypothetical protein
VTRRGSLTGNLGADIPEQLTSRNVLPKKFVHDRPLCWSKVMECV